MSNRGDEGQELKDGVAVRCSEGVWTPLLAVWAAVGCTETANGDDFAGEFNVQGEFGEPCFLLKMRIQICCVKREYIQLHEQLQSDFSF